MKFKTTQKAIKQGHTNVISVSYCALQALLNKEQPAAYTIRAEGWAADIYIFGNTAIVTGYAPFGNIKPSYEVNQKYESKAQAIKARAKTWQEEKEQLRALITEYIKEVTQ